MRIFHSGLTGVSLALLIVVAGCGIMPASGPSSQDIRAGQADPAGLQYILVPVTPKVIETLAAAAPRLATAFADRRPAKEIRFGIGDIVSVTIFEAQPGGLFIPAEAGVRPGNFVTIPNQAVDAKGNISIPYAGAIRARGRTQIELQDAIVAALKDRAIEPQVVVSLVQAQSSLISVLGDVAAPTRVAANPAGERLLDVIARAGGPRSPGHDEWVLLERNGRRALAPFGALVYEPVNNIFVDAGDTIYLYREPQTFLAFGALSAVASGVSNSQINFDAWRLSLAEAVGKVGGLNDATADPASVFLYRGETREVAQQLGLDISGFTGPIIPVIYNLNLRDPAGFYLATKFEMRNKDVIYVSNAVSVEVSKFLQYLRLINGTINDPIQTAISAYTLRNVINGGANVIVSGGQNVK
ncbi:MAG TPA: polysaccharide biosynthesis/export family protein [Lacipirellulaceae bacterium]|nr:polysaccharide biosynthesis/export family protein [Lacipirellulaceae bacterium]